MGRIRISGYRGADAGQGQSAVPPSQTDQCHDLAG